LLIGNLADSPAGGNAQINFILQLKIIDIIV